MRTWHAYPCFFPAYKESNVWPVYNHFVSVIAYHTEGSVLDINATAIDFASAILATLSGALHVSYFPRQTHVSPSPFVRDVKISTTFKRSWGSTRAWLTSVTCLCLKKPGGTFGDTRRRREICVGGNAHGGRGTPGKRQTEGEGGARLGRSARQEQEDGDRGKSNP